MEEILLVLREYAERYGFFYFKNIFSKFWMVGCMVNQSKHE